MARRSLGGGIVFDQVTGKIIESATSLPNMTEPSHANENGAGGEYQATVVVNDARRTMKSSYNVDNNLWLAGCPYRFVRGV
jgi:hypothetical protein